MHMEDRTLVDEGRIPARCLFTLRQGEMVRENVKGILAPLSTEIIKIKGYAGSWTCQFLDRATRGCGIYDHRPLECRALNCRDTRRIEKIYEATRLTRQDLLSGIDGLWDLIQAHEQRCSYVGLRERVGEGTSRGRLRREKTILEILRFDVHVRRLASEKGRVDRRIMDFVFGRPLADTIHMLGVNLEKKKGTYTLALRPGFSREQPGA